jgi:hypothetical protein
LALAAATLAAGGCAERAESAGYEVRMAPGGKDAGRSGEARQPSTDATALTLAVVVPAGTSRERLAAIRDELKGRYAAAKLLRLGFFDDATAADQPQGPDAPAPKPEWWGHYLAQYNLNRNTGYEWFGRLHPDRAERWE